MQTAKLGPRMARRLEEAKNNLEKGIVPERRKGGWSDIDSLRALVRLGLLVERQDGPRGGSRWYLNQV